ncbi:hypothetical protein PoB_003047900 [Plakobranchus ocellatus]|uniref:Uncharacterized protein n=1 Tax=Plakobranchus ocellatus TaxID=259542 RepID=A0AAV4ACN7_9GAST|nr:hypothetical protein PoB_003047900 [Plakobranchus ocellatus]
MCLAIYPLLNLGAFLLKHVFLFLYLSAYACLPSRRDGLQVEDSVKTTVWFSSSSRNFSPIYRRDNRSSELVTTADWSPDRGTTGHVVVGLAGIEARLPALRPARTLQSRVRVQAYHRGNSSVLAAVLLVFLCIACPQQGDLGPSVPLSGQSADDVAQTHGRGIPVHLKMDLLSSVPPMHFAIHCAANTLRYPLCYQHTLLSTVLQHSSLFTVPPRHFDIHCAANTLRYPLCYQHTLLSTVLPTHFAILCATNYQHSSLFTVPPRHFDIHCAANTLCYPLCCQLPTHFAYPLCYQLLTHFAIHCATNTLRYPLCYQHTSLSTVPPTHFAIHCSTNTLRYPLCHRHTSLSIVLPTHFAIHCATNTLRYPQCHRHTSLSIVLPTPSLAEKKCKDIQPKSRWELRKTSKRIGRTLAKTGLTDVAQGCRADGMVVVYDDDGNDDGDGGDDDGGSDGGVVMMMCVAAPNNDDDDDDNDDDDDDDDDDDENKKFNMNDLQTYIFQGLSDFPANIPFIKTYIKKKV